MKIKGNSNKYMSLEMQTTVAATKTKEIARITAYKLNNS